MLVRIAMKQVLLSVAVLVLCTTSWAATEINDDQYVIFYHNDMLGSPAVVTDHNGNTLWYEHSEPYGRERDRISHSGTEFLSDNAGSRKGYTGHLKDEGADLVYMKGRYYDPVIGRFYSNDPVGFNTENLMMYNRYAYANNNPYTYFDPNGMEAKKTRAQRYADMRLPDPNAELMEKREQVISGMNIVADVIEPSALDLVGIGIISKGGKLTKGIKEAAEKSNSVPNKSIGDLIRAGEQADKNGLTQAGRALQKHGDRQGSVFPRSTGSAAQRNQQGRDILSEILKSSNQTKKPNRFGGTDIFDDNTGRGARFDGDGIMKGFLEP